MRSDSLSVCRGPGEGVALPPEGGCSGCTVLAIDRLHLLARYVSHGISDLADYCPHEFFAALTRRMCSSSVPAPGSASSSCLLTAKYKKASPTLRGIGCIPVLQTISMKQDMSEQLVFSPSQPLVVHARIRGMRQGLAQQFGVPEPVHRTALFEEICRLEPEALTCTSSPKLPLHALQLRVHLSQRPSDTAGHSCMQAGLRGAP